MGFFPWMLLNDIHYVINVTDVTYNFIRNLFAHKFVKLSNQKKIYNFSNLYTKDHDCLVLVDPTSKCIFECLKKWKENL